MQQATVHAGPSARAPRTLWLVAAIVVAVILLSLVVLRGRLTPGADQALPRINTGTTEAAAPPATEALNTERVPVAPAPMAIAPSTVITADANDSLAGTDVDGAVTLDANGRIVLNLDLRRLFDYLLARSGEMSEEQLRHWSEQVLRARYPANAEALVGIFRRYLLLRERMAEIGKSDSLAQDLDRLSALRTQVLGTELARAFFADDEALARFALARQELQARSALIPAAQRRANEAALLDTLPAHLREAWEELLEQEAISTTAQNLDTQAPLTNLDPAAQARLAQLQAERAEFEQRVRRYLDARTPNMSETEREALRTRWLSPEERTRVAALEAIGQEQSLFTPPPNP